MTLTLIRRIILPAALLVFAVAAIAGATGAFFNDTETSTGNTFAAGAIDLKIDNTSYAYDWNIPGITSPNGTFMLNPQTSWLTSDLGTECTYDPTPNDPNNPNDSVTHPCVFFNFDDLKPGDIGEDTISVVVDNNNAYACMALDLTATPENLVNEAEADVPDTTVTANDGELQNYLTFTFWNDDGDNVFEDGETVISGLNNVLASALNGAWQAINGGTQLTGAQTYYVGKAWCFGTLTPVNGIGLADVDPNSPTNNPVVRGTGFTCSGVGDQNVAQTDGVTMDVSFYSVQARNNSALNCSTLPALNSTNQCNDGINNDGVEDALIDANDPGCTTGTNQTTEADGD